MAADPTADLGAGAPGEAARQLYLGILAAGGLVPFADFSESDRPALDQLMEIGLVMPNLMDSVYTAVSPRTVAGRVSAELRSEATRLLVRAEGLPGALDGLTKAYDAVPRRADQRGEATHIEGHEHIRHQIEQLVADCKEGLLSTQPGPRPADALDMALRQDLPLLRRGRTMRTIYQPTAMAEPAAVKYAAAVTEHGAQIRVLDENFQRMLIFDRAVAVVPAADDHSKAVFITDSAAVTFLVAVFERDWARADSVVWGSSEEGRSRVPERVGRLLAQGFTQRAVATRLGLSERTVAGHISRLRERYGAQTLFQLGWLMRGGRGE
ncbi:LuxR C-terminal-related transcriptional regulator [Kitasatospora atroaurantiaca]|uniref:LuxR C-terminal-related transcriptional regulator n=1 Tax=Kitasatospora atroaurantiaca TaxID=285545 RepID=UPI0011AAE66A|nr:LuxR C-terminal-related transcriptional regulator [Kitasatospora atroaurantiaca]